MGNSKEIILHSGLNKFLYKSGNLIEFEKNTNLFHIIKLDLEIKQLAHIKKNFDSFISILNLLLSLYNEQNSIKFKNISFCEIILDNQNLGTCILLFNNKKSSKNGFINLKFTKYNKKKNKTDEIFDKIVYLIKNRQISVRNLIKIGLPQIKARKLYDFLKLKGVFEISKENNNYKKYNFENLKNISKQEILNIIYTGV